MQAILQFVGVLFAGGGLALLGYRAAQDLSRRGKGKHLAAFAGVEEEKAAIAEKLEEVLGRVISLQEWERRLLWVQRNGEYEGKRLGDFVLQSLLLGGAGLLFVLLVNSALLFWSLPVIGVLLPWVRLYSAAADARDATVKELPAIASLVAAELAAGTPPEEAVRRAAELPGPLAGLLEDSLHFARETGRPLFALPTAQVQGALVEIFTRVGVPQLSAFARQLNMVAVKGMEGATLMNSIAEALADEYQADLEKQLEQLDTRIWPVIALFFFFPFVGILIIVNLVPALQAMGLGGM